MIRFPIAVPLLPLRPIIRLLPRAFLYTSRRLGRRGGKETFNWGIANESPRVSESRAELKKNQPLSHFGDHSPLSVSPHLAFIFLFYVVTVFFLLFSFYQHVGDYPSSSQTTVPPKISPQVLFSCNDGVAMRLAPPATFVRFAVVRAYFVNALFSLGLLLPRPPNPRCR
ncbi:hypothetical protein MRX96_029080 [Rhipicephalus microplus]